MAKRKLEIEYRDVESLTAYEANSRTHTEFQVSQLAVSIKEYGWTNPILIDPEGGVIAGHAGVYGPA